MFTRQYAPSQYVLGTVSKRGRRRQNREARKICLRNPASYFTKLIFALVTLYVSFSLKFRWLQQRLLLNETMEASSWNVGHVLKTAWKWSSWSLIWEQDGTNVSFISHIQVRFLSCVISLIVLPTLPSPSSAVLLKVPYYHVQGRPVDKMYKPNWLELNFTPFW